MGTWLTEMIAFLNDTHAFDTRMILLSSRANNFSARAPHMALRQDVTLIERDIRSVFEIPEEVTWIIHAAGNPDNRQHASDPLKTIEVIVNGTNAILECVTRLPDLKKFLNISSGLVYGAQPWEMDALPEGFFGNLDCGSISSAYSEAKRLGETICAVYRNQHRLPIVNARPFAFIGPYQLLDRPWAVNNFIRDSLLAGPIRILGDGETVRSYMYPSDMAFWILSILIHGSVGTSYNVGSPHGVTLRNLAEKIASCFPSRPKIISHLSRDDKLRRNKFVPDVSLASNTLGLRLSVDLDTAIRRTILWNQVKHSDHLKLG
jgi:dTDP-glucose 4,6-dehydratase